MNKPVTQEQLTELKDWMIAYFFTKEEGIRLAKGLSNLESTFLTFQDLTLTRFDRVFGFLEKLDQERIFMHYSIEKLENGQSRLEQQQKNLEEEQTLIKKILIHMDEKLDRIEAKLN